MDKATAMHERVAELLRQVGRAIVLPRFRSLAAGEIEEKSPGELVTVVDRKAEAALGRGLSAILPEARVVGEEACAADASLLDGLDRGSAWVVDPLDGTANFASGKPPFGIIVALARDGVCEAGWLYDPLADRLCHAVSGGGAFVNGARVRTPRSSPKPIATLATQFMAAEARARLTAAAAGCFALHPIPRCAAEHYPRLVSGACHVALFQRTLPWDHAAGALFLDEAGGKVARWDGSPYRFADGRAGLLAASTPALWQDAAERLLAGEMGLDERRPLLPQAIEPAIMVGFGGR